jgi:hypothetical protein
MIAASIFTDDHAKCKNFLRHKTHLLSPEFLTGNSVPLSSLTQHAGEFVITFPRAYHFGFNLGLNCAESTNFALPSWLQYAGGASRCVCSAGRGVARIDPARFLLYSQAQLGCASGADGCTGGSCAGGANASDTAPARSSSQAGPSGATAANERFSCHNCFSGSSTQDPDDAIVIETDYVPTACSGGAAKRPNKRKHRGATRG